MTLGIRSHSISYIGYFQLLAAVDRFVVYDDVTFIRVGSTATGYGSTAKRRSLPFPLAHKSSG